MDPAQVAVLWTLVIHHEAPRRPGSAKPSRSFGARFGAAVRRFAYRGQLGPVAGSSAA